MKQVNLVLAILIFFLSVLSLFNINLIDGRLQSLLLSFMMGSFFVLHAKELEKNKIRFFLTVLGYFTIAISAVRVLFF